MYNFIKIQYLIGRLTAAQVRAYAPRWITTAQATEIVLLKEDET